MNKIIIAAAAVLALSGSAFAGSDNYNANSANPQAATSVDNSRTGSIRENGSPVYKLLNSSGDVQKPAPQGSDRNLFGH